MSTPRDLGSFDRLLRRASILGHRPQVGLSEHPHRADPFQIRRGHSGSKPDEVAAAQADYAHHLQMAIGILKDSVGFGTAPESPQKPSKWEVANDEDFKLCLKAKGLPSEALQDIFDNPQGLRFDCAEWVQLVNMYATLKAHGEKYFDQIKPGDFTLRQHRSAILSPSHMVFRRDSPSQKFELLIPELGNAHMPDFIDEAVLLAAVPIGSGVGFMNDAIATGTAFYYENALKDGEKTFAAHPLGDKLTKEQVIQNLSHHNKIKYGYENQANIFINRVEIFGTIPIGPKTHEALGTADIFQKLLPSSFISLPGKKSGPGGK